MTMVERTATAMARGGIYDQLAGGFARYSVDAGGWCRTSRRCSTTTRCCWACTRTGGGAPATRWPSGWWKTVDWLLSEMRTHDGAFAASLDADSLDAHGRHPKARLRLDSRPADGCSRRRGRRLGGGHLLG